MSPGLRASGATLQGEVAVHCGAGTRISLAGRWQHRHLRTLRRRQPLMHRFGRPELQLHLPAAQEMWGPVTSDRLCLVEFAWRRSVRSRVDAYQPPYRCVWSKQGPGQTSVFSMPVEKKKITPALTPAQ